MVLCGLVRDLGWEWIGEGDLGNGEDGIVQDGIV